MWKYECKRHLLYLLISAAAGAVLFGITIDDSFIKEITSLYDWMPIEVARQAYELLVKAQRKMSEEEFLRCVQNLGRDNGRTPMQWSGQKNAAYRR